MRLAFIAAVALVVAGCTPVPTTTPDSAVPVQSADAASCAARGGEMRRVGRLQSLQCVVKYADAGKRCTDGDQCAGDCRIDGNSGITPGTAAVGQCQANSDRFGCHTAIEDGKATATLCID